MSRRSTPLARLAGIASIALLAGAGAASADPDDPQGAGTTGAEALPAPAIPVAPPPPAAQAVVALPRSRGFWSVSARYGTLPQGTSVAPTTSGGVYFGRGLFDDDAPLALQPFLAGVGAVRFTVGYERASGDARGYPTGYLLGTVSHTTGTAVEASGYVAGGHLYLGGGLAAALTTTTHQIESPPYGPTPPYLGVGYDQWLWYLSAAVGFRQGDLLVVARYATRASYFTGATSSWGILALDGRWVVHRRVDLRLSVETRDRGAFVEGGAAVYVGKSLGVEFGVVFERTSASGGTSSDETNLLGGSLGLSYWVNRHFGVAAGYQLVAPVSAAAFEGYLAHQGSVTLQGRGR